VALQYAKQLQTRYSWREGGGALGVLKSNNPPCTSHQDVFEVINTSKGEWWFLRQVLQTGV